MRKSKCKFTSLFEKDKPIAVVLGGVLSALAFSLIPNFASALQVNKLPNSSDYFRSSHTIRGGCIATTVEIGGGINWLVGSNLDDITDPCSYRTVDNPSPTHLSYGSMSSGRSSITYNGLTKTDDTYDSGSITNDTRYWSAIPRPIYNSVSGFTLDIEPQSGYFRTILQDSGTIDSYGLFLYSYSSLTGTTGFVPDFVSDFTVYDSNGNDISDTTYLDSTYKNVIKEKIQKSVNYSCGDIVSQTPVPEEFDTSTFTTDSCFLTFVVPSSANFILEFPDGFFFAGASQDYNINDANGNPIPRWRLSMFQMSNSYQDMNTNWNNELKHDLPVFQYMLPQTQEDADYLMNFAETLFGNHEYNMNNLGTPPNSSIYQNWWDVFTFSFTFPFQNLFTAFTDNQCVDIPIIAGMLHSSNSRYCTWWSADVRNILTPVITMASLMLATGFAMRWLSEKSSVITIGGK